LPRTDELTRRPNSPAGRAGLSAEFLIRKIDGISVEGKSLPECLGMISGPADTKVELEIFNSERNETSTIELTRQRFVTSTG
jgi:C-terminal processing protease CtpA/Prc